jgi:predicted outer membrane repeat protein
MTANKASFIGNTAQMGGAIFSSASAVTIADGYFRRNTAISSGGAITADSSMLSISGSFIENSAVFHGGAIRLVSSIGIFENVSFNANSANTNGGAISLNNSSMTINGGSFIGNSAATRGGAIYFNDSEGLIIDASFSGNTAADGGAVFLRNSQLRIIAQDANINFSSNTSSRLGGAFMLENSSLTISAKNRNIIFADNKSIIDGQVLLNDIYLNDDSVLIFDPAANRQIELRSGIMGNVNNTIIKSSGGVLSVSGNVSFEGDFKLQGGTVKVATTTIRIGQLSAGSGTYLTNGLGRKVTTSVNTFSITNAIWDLGIYFMQNTHSLDSDIIEGQSLDISGLTLKVSANGLFSYDLLYSTAVIFQAADIIGFDDIAKRGEIIYANSPFPLFYTLSRDADRIYLTLEGEVLNMPDLTHNEQEVINILNSVTTDEDFIEIRNQIVNFVNEENISGAKKALNDLSGAFLLNVLNGGFNNNDFARLYWKLNKYGYEKTNEASQAWVDFSISGSENKDKHSETLKTNMNEILAGVDIAHWTDLKLGIYGSVSKNDLKQASNEGHIDSFEAGLYAMTFLQRLNVIANISIGYQNWDTTREISFMGKTASSVFNASIIKGGFEADYDLFKAGSIWFKPFVSVTGGYLSTDKIEEKGGGIVSLSIEPQKRFKAEFIGGIKAQKNEGQFNYHIQAYYKGVLNSGDLNTDISFRDSKNYGPMDIESMDEKREYMGAQGGINYTFMNGIELFALADANTSIDDGYFGYLAKGGLIIRFGNIEPSQKDQDLFANAESSKEEEKPAVEESPKQEIEYIDDGLDGKIEVIIPDDIDEKPQPSVAQERISYESDYEMVAEEEIHIDESVFLKEEIKQSQRRRADASIKAFNLSAVAFNSGSTQLMPSARVAIKDIANKIKSGAIYRITIEGHTDSSGNESNNLKLSQERARVIYNELIRNGISQEKLKYIGFGSKMPIADNQTKSGRQSNRRVEIFVE